LLLIAGLSVNALGCSDDDGAPANHRPVAKIAAAPAGTIGKIVTLDGKDSSDEDKETLHFGWTVKSAPKGSKVAKLEKSDTVQASFTPDLEGDYVIALVVDDGHDNSPEATATVKVSKSANQKPVAKAGDAQNVKIGATVTLDGSKSEDGDKDKLTYAWTLKAPEKSTAVLDKADAEKPTFKADLAGDYEATLIVNDGKEASEAAKVTITAKANAKPLAVAGAGFVTKNGEAITLDGSKSEDGDKDKLTYAWTLDKKPTDSAAALTDDKTEKPSIKPDKAGSYVLSLVVDDGEAKSDKVSIEIVAQDGDLKPIAKIAPPAAPKVGVSADIDGSSSLAPKGATLTYTWKIASAPTGSTATLPANAAKIAFKADVEGKYTFELKVNDGKGDSEVVSSEIEFKK
jgi:hypothetical protein